MYDVGFEIKQKKKADQRLIGFLKLLLKKIYFFAQ